MNGDVKTKIIKRNGEEVTFDLNKIINAITKANEEVTKIHQMNQYQIMAIAEKVADQVAEAVSSDFLPCAGIAGKYRHDAELLRD